MIDIFWPIQFLFQREKSAQRDDMDMKIDSDGPSSEGQDTSKSDLSSDSEDKTCIDTVDSAPNTCSILVSSLPHQDKNPKPKRKQFKFAEMLYTVILFEDSYEDVESRSKYWEFQACNRDRFNERIKRVGLELSPILSPDHRSKIYAQRFENNDPDE